VKLMALKPFKLKTKDGPKLYQPGEIFETCSPQAGVYIQEGFFKPVEESRPPIRPGWVVAYQGRDGRVEAGSIKECKAKNSGWIIALEDGKTLQEKEILSVGKVENNQWIASWTVKDWGLDGNRPDRILKIGEKGHEY
jgi:hypothetical protein